jgi:hypothetical protein
MCLSLGQIFRSSGASESFGDPGSIKQLIPPGLKTIAKQTDTFIANSGVLVTDFRGRYLLTADC